MIASINIQYLSCFSASYLSVLTPPNSEETRGHSLTQMPCPVFIFTVYVSSSAQLHLDQNASIQS